MVVWVLRWYQTADNAPQIFSFVLQLQFLGLRAGRDDLKLFFGVSDEGLCVVDVVRLVFRSRWLRWIKLSSLLTHLHGRLFILLLLLQVVPKMVPVEFSKNLLRINLEGTDLKEVDNNDSSQDFDQIEESHLPLMLSYIHHAHLQVHPHNLGPADIFSLLSILGCGVLAQKVELCKIFFHIFYVFNFCLNCCLKSIFNQKS